MTEGTPDLPPMQVKLRAKYLPSKGTWGYKSKHNQQGAKRRRKNGRKQEHDHRVPVLVDGRRLSWMRHSAWLASRGRDA